MGIDITDYERRQLEGQSYLIRPLLGANGVQRSTYHDPITGQEFENLPIDPRSYQGYTVGSGWRLGPAPEELKAKWAAGEAERTAAWKQKLATHKVVTPSLPSNVPGFAEAVAEAVVQVLKTLGIETPPEVPVVEEVVEELMPSNITNMDEWLSTFSDKTGLTSLSKTGLQLNVP